MRVGPLKIAALLVARRLQDRLAREAHGVEVDFPIPRGTHGNDLNHLIQRDIQSIRLCRIKVAQWWTETLKFDSQLHCVSGVCSPSRSHEIDIPPALGHAGQKDALTMS